MKKSNLRGAGTVFRYTAQQHYKTRSVIIFLAVLFIIAVCSLPAAALISGGSKDVSETAIKTLYLRNETGFPLDTSLLLEDERYQAVKIEETEEDDEALNKRLTEESGAAASVVTMDAEEYHFAVNTRYGKEGDVSHADAASLNNVLGDVLHKSLMQAIGVTAEQEDMIHAGTVSQVSKVSDFLRGEEETSADTHVFANIVYSYFIIMLCAMSMSYIFQQCMEEKVSKLVEMLMVSVSPTALLLGKILAVTLFIFGGFALVAAGLLISYQIAKQVADVSVVQAMIIKLLKFDPASLNLNASTLVLFVICTLLVYAMFSALSGIAGSCCSKTEDTQQASLIVVMVLMLGYMTSTLAPIFESDAANVFFSLFPITSVFSAFPNYVCGKISLPVLLLGIAIQAVTAVLLIRIAGSVYKMMLLYRGGFPKPKQLIQMLKEYKASGKHGKEDSHAV